LFEFLKRKTKSDSPLEDPNALARWFEELPAGDIAVAQKAVVAKLIEFNQSTQDYGKNKLAILRTLDERAREMQTSLCALYLGNPLMSAATEARLWALIQAFYFEIARGYHAFLMRYVANPNRGLKGDIPLISARTLRALADVIKWRYFHFERIDGKLWLRMHNLFQVAEFEGFLDKNLKLYGSDRRASSCQEEYVQALLLSSFGGGNMPARQIEMIDQWLDVWAGEVRCDKTFDPERHCLYVDTSAGQGLRRIRNPGVHSAWRYLGAAPLRAKIEEIKARLDEGKKPVTLGLGANFHPAEGMALLDRVQGEWAPLEERERRRGKREPRKGRWEIVRDLDNIFIVLQNPNGNVLGRPSSVLTQDEVMDLKLYGFVTERTKAAKAQATKQSVAPEKRDRWFQLDTSDTGIGFIVTGTGGNWAKAGRLLAMRQEGGDGDWQVGVIQRVMAHQDGQRGIGVNLLPGQIECVDMDLEAMLPNPEMMKDGYEVHDASHGLGAQGSALLITMPDGGQGVLMEASRYGHGREYLIRPNASKPHLIQLRAVQDKGDGWVIAAYEQVA